MTAFREPHVCRIILAGTPIYRLGAAMAAGQNSMWRAAVLCLLSTGFLIGAWPAAVAQTTAGTAERMQGNLTISGPAGIVPRR
jgi:hypothetical protein